MDPLKGPLNQRSGSHTMIEFRSLVSCAPPNRSNIRLPSNAYANVVMRIRGMVRIAVSYAQEAIWKELTVSTVHT
jgi:predicted DNA-binding protein (UPF0278 family)